MNSNEIVLMGGFSVGKLSSDLLVYDVKRNSLSQVEVTSMFGLDSLS